MPYLDIWLGDTISNSENRMMQHIIKGVKTRGPTITKLTLKRLLFSKKTWVLVVLCAIPVLIALLWITTDEVNGYTFFSDLVLSFLFFIVLIVCLLYGVAAFNDDITDKTIIYLISRPVDRAELTVYKYIGYIISAFVVVIPTLILTFFIIASKEGDIGNNIGVLTTFIGIFFLAVVCYGAIFILFGLLFKRPMLISFVFIFVWESFLGNLRFDISRITIRHYLGSIGYHVLDRGEATNVWEPVDTTISIIVLLVTALSFLVFAMLVARNKDFA